jgi:hypothetical protein
VLFEQGPHVLPRDLRVRLRDAQDKAVELVPPGLHDLSQLLLLSEGRHLWGLKLRGLLEVGMLLLPMVGSRSRVA